MLRRRTTGRKLCSAVVAGALILGAALEARASTEEDVLIVLGIGVVAMDFVFTGYDIGVAAKGEAPENGWLIAETIFTTPQTLLLNGAMPFVVAEEREPAAVALFVPTVMVGTMTAHGVTGLLYTDEPAEQIGVSAALATNTALTSAALTRTFMGELSTISMAATEVSATVPQLIVGTVKLATDEEDRSLWIGVTAWAGGLFLHGLASLIWGGDKDEPILPESLDFPPPPPPPPPPLEVPEEPLPSEEPLPHDAPLPPLSAAPRSGRGASVRSYSRAHPGVASPRVHFAPTVVSDGVIQAPGLGLRGVF